MDIVTPDELFYLQEASARADQRVLDLMAQARQGEYFGPRLRVAGDMGDYVVPPILSWQTLYDVVKNPELGDIDYSIKKYPHFDGLVDANLRSDEFNNPLNAKYEKWTNLRDNIACVRNYLLIHYFEQNPNGIPENKAEAMLEEIATFIGKGCYNNFRFLGLIPNHNPLEPFIDVEKANLPDGEGARYIYERILARNRHSSWLRPLDALVDFFTGSSSSDWQLPNVEETPFHPAYAKIVSDDVVSEAMVDEALFESNRLRNLLKEAYQARDSQTGARNLAVDMDTLGNHLLYSAASAHHISTLQEPVRRDAIELAKDILNKLKIKFGNVDIKEGLRLQPQDDSEVVGKIQSVMTIYERLLAHACSVNASVLNHPAVISATQAFGQFGYMAKLEAYRFANMVGDTSYAQMLGAQLGRIPDFYAQATHRTVGELISRIETGMDVMIERMQSISGPAAFLSTDVRETVGMSMATPTAGLQAQVAAAIGVQGNLQAQQANMAADQAARTQASRLMAEQAQKGGAQVSTSSGTGRSALADAKKTVSNTNASVAPIDPRSVRVPIAGSQAAMKAQQQVGKTVNSQDERGKKQGIPPLVLQAAMQMRSDKITPAQDHHPLPASLNGPSAIGFKPSATPNTKQPKKKIDPNAPVPKTLAEAEEARRLQLQQQQTHPGKPQGRTI